MTLPLFDEWPELDHGQLDVPRIDLERVLGFFDPALHSDLTGTIQRLWKASRADGDDDMDQARGVRSL
jgi:hypothetical protein